MSVGFRGMFRTLEAQRNKRLLHLNGDILYQLKTAGKLLCSGCHVGINTINSQLIFGVKGNIKTELLTFISKILPSFLPRTIPVQISFSNEKKLHRRPLTALISEELKKHGVNDNFARGENDSARWIDALKQSDRYLILVVDELDNLYRQPKHDFYRTELEDLSYLANQDSGRVLTILTGESMALPQLVSGGMVDHEEFPMASESPDLGCSKYHTSNIKTRSPYSIPSSFTYGNRDQLSAFRTINFFTGGTSSFQLHKSENLGDPVKKAFWDSLVEKFLQKNDQLFQQLAEKNSVTIESIGSVKWEDLEPVTDLEIEQIVAELKRNNPDYSNVNSITLIPYFCDCSWLVAERMYMSSITKFYPTSLLVLANQYFLKRGDEMNIYDLMCSMQELGLFVD